MIHKSENPVTLAGARVLESIGFSPNAENDNQNLIELQATWLRQRYPISWDRARLIAGLHFGGLV